MSSDDISQLIARVAMRDRQAFSRLYVLASAKLFGVALRILKDRALAEDVLQEVFLKIWRNAAGFSAERASAMSWLIAIARNQSIDRLRARQPAQGDLDEAEQVRDPAADPEAVALQRSEGARIEDCMQELAAERAAAVREAYVEGYSYQELAERYRVPLNTMRTWLRRSLMQLRKCLER